MGIGTGTDPGPDAGPDSTLGSGGVKVGLNTAAEAFIVKACVGRGGVGGL